MTVDRTILPSSRRGGYLSARSSYRSRSTERSRGRAVSIGQLITQTAMILIIRQPFRVYIQFIYNYDHLSHKDEASNCMSNSFNWQSLILHPPIHRASMERGTELQDCRGTGLLQEYSLYALFFTIIS